LKSTIFATRSKAGAKGRGFSETLYLHILPAQLEATASEKI